METTRHQVQDAKRQLHQAELIVHCLETSQRTEKINGRPLILSGNGEIYIDIGDTGDHRITPHFQPYHWKPYEGLATSTTADAAPIQDRVPMLNCIYLDAHSQQLKYGVREDTESHLAGTVDCSPQNQHLIFQGWEGFCAVEVQPSIWAIYFDINDDGLKDKVPPGMRILDIELERREMKNKFDALPQTVGYTTEVEEVEDHYHTSSTSSYGDEVSQDHVLGTAISIMCTRIERTERHVKEEFLLTIPGPPMGGDGLPLQTRLLETRCHEDIETEATEHFYSSVDCAIVESGLSPIFEESFIETPTPSPEDINRLEAQVVAMLGLKQDESETSELLDSDTSTDLFSHASLHAKISARPDIASKPLPPLPLELLSISSPERRPSTPEQKPQDLNRGPDSAIALVQSPTIYPGSPHWNTSRSPRTPATLRQSRINLRPDDVSLSLDFGDRPVHSLSACTNVWGETPKEPPMKKFLHRLNGSNKKILSGVKNAGPRVFRIKHRKPDASPTIGRRYST